MNKDAVKNIQETFKANPAIDQFFHNPFGHCFAKPDSPDLIAITREEAGKLVADDGEAKDDANGEGAKEPGKGKGKK